MMNESNGERLEPYKPPFSVWELIKSTVPPKELPLVKSYIGESMIEYCLDLRNELESLLDIWKMVGEQLEPPTITKSIYSEVLPDPPKLREMLTKEIHMLVKCLQEKDDYTEKIKFQDSDKKVIQYAMMSQSTHTEKERPSTPLRKKEVENLYTTSPVKLKHIRRNINVTDIDAVADILKDAIKNECTTLEHDIEFLQKCVEEEHALASSRPSSPIEEPSIVALRQVCKSLENRTISESSANTNQTASRISPAKLPTPPSPKRIQLKPMEASYRPTSSKMHGERSFGPTTSFYSVPSSPNVRHKFGQNHSLHSQHPTETEVNKKVTECWIEPEWSHCMSDSPPTTADSGVGSRPATCDISAIQEKMLMLSSRSGANTGTLSDTSPRSSYDSAKNGNSNFQNHLNTFSPLSYNQIDCREEEEDEELLKINCVNDVKKPSTSVIPHTSVVFKPILPHPPKLDGTKPARPTVNARRLSRKPVKTN